tara:strand:+ start:292 stop:582 length:291 start_codon:yes stop_codon:yes gene_type:complete
MNKFILSLIFAVFLFSGCAITYEPPRCELMLRGEECLSDHRCCNPPQTYYQTRPYWNWWYWNKPQNNYIFIKPNKPNKPNNKPSKPNNKPNKGHRK